MFQINFSCLLCSQMSMSRQFDRDLEIWSTTCLSHHGNHSRKIHFTTFFKNQTVCKIWPGFVKCLFICYKCLTCEKKSYRCFFKIGILLSVAVLVLFQIGNKLNRLNSSICKYEFLLQNFNWNDHCKTIKQQIQYNEPK